MEGRSILTFYQFCVELQLIRRHDFICKKVVGLVCPHGFVKIGELLCFLMSPSLPDHIINDGKKVFDISNSAMDQIIFNVEGDIKDIITYLAKDPNNQYGNTTTAVLHQWILDKLDSDHNITFTTKTKTLSSNVKELTELEKLNLLKKRVRELKKLADFGYYQAELQSGMISMDAVNVK